MKLLANEVRQIVCPGPTRNAVYSLLKCAGTLSPTEHVMFVLSWLCSDF